MLARVLLVENRERLSSLRTSTIWASRTAFAHQRILSSPAETLRKIVDTNSEKAIFTFSADRYSFLICFHCLLVFNGFLPGQYLPCSIRSEEHTSELQSLMRISYAVFCLKNKIYLILIKYYTTTLKCNK